MPEIPEIDTSIIDSLKEIREEQAVLEDRLAKMEEKRESVSDAVYERVKGDYKERLSELDDEARPLEESGRREWARLQTVYEEMQETQAEARLEKEELEFRHELGEFDDGEFEERLGEVQERLESQEEEMEQVAALRQEFIDAFGSEERLQEAPEPEEGDQIPGETEVEPEEVPAHEVTEETEVTEVAEVAEETEAEPPIEEVPPPPDEKADVPEEPPERSDLEHAAATEFIPTEPPPEEPEEPEPPTDTVETEPAPAEPPPPPGEEPEAETAEAPEGDQGVTRILDTGGEATQILSKPRLETIEGNDPGESFILGALPVTLGRSSNNTIHLLEEAVSRHHAELIPGPDGYLLRDLGSENGTYVNGKKKKEHLLKDGDVIQIGLRKLVFKET
ncbi:MAG: FHA domain-containing protein [Thermoanaerobaculia bacterium]|nr:FHA domain-containing protein [Thermoanaerobaculia bacterium]